jgi:hypothetical protein
MHTSETVAAVLELRERGMGARRISAATGIPVRTVTDWLRGRTPRHVREGDWACGGDCGVRTDVPSSAYGHLLGLYLGDGCISAHARGVFRLRITLDARYPAIVDACEAAMREILPRNKVTRVVREGRWIEVSSYSKHWPCLFPQHGPGRKHERTIHLQQWQWDLVERDPWPLLRGLIESDGCRFVNGDGRGWTAPRYSFKNSSEDIREIFSTACDLAGLRWTSATDTVYVSRKDDVARLDAVIGPKS